MRNHKTVKLAWTFGNEPEDIDIDEKLAPLIRLLWDADIMTLQCCEEEHPGLSCIEFPGTGEVMEFLDVAQRNYKIEVESFNESDEGEPLSMHVRLLVLFPLADVPYLVDAFANRDQEQD